MVVGTMITGEEMLDMLDKVNLKIIIRRIRAIMAMFVPPAPAAYGSPVGKFPSRFLVHVVNSFFSVRLPVAMVAPVLTLLCMDLLLQTGCGYKLDNLFEGFCVLSTAMHSSTVVFS
ncbi:hypothetical protein C4D60_Mb07t05100 [Musa balbisiana]|uniref:Uncharacterized protein n=1 Tax=Musa balbisiana TaxID=52838 RepID=A0A4V4H6F5_MUSBA|nr:hypothetical protein C4D60_Mb07t05100 [Musa balbisiana]